MFCGFVVVWFGFLGGFWVVAYLGLFFCLVVCGLHFSCGFDLLFRGICDFSGPTLILWSLSMFSLVVLVLGLVCRVLCTLVSDISVILFIHPVVLSLMSRHKYVSLIIGYFCGYCFHCL